MVPLDCIADHRPVSNKGTKNCVHCEEKILELPRVPSCCAVPSEPIFLSRYETDGDTQMFVGRTQM